MLADDECFHNKTVIRFWKFCNQQLLIGGVFLTPIYHIIHDRMKKTFVDGLLSDIYFLPFSGCMGHQHILFK
jgi:hypothetical protein